MQRKKQKKQKGVFFGLIPLLRSVLGGGSLKKRQRGGLFMNRKKYRRRRQKGGSVALKTLGGFNKDKYRRSLDLPVSRNSAFSSRRIVRDW